LKKVLICCMAIAAVLLGGCGSPPEPVDTTLHTAVQEGMISVMINPKSISESNIDITNKSGAPLNITVESGTYLLSASEAKQNMLITNPRKFTLAAGKTETFLLDTACMNIKRAIPGPNDSYSVDKLGSNNLLTKAVDYFGENNTESFALIQAVVWIITDNANSEQMKSLRTSTGQYVIGFPDFSSAVSIVNTLKAEE